MSITYRAKDRVFHLQTKNTSYMMELVGEGHLVHGYWGKKVHTPPIGGLIDRYEVCSFSPNPAPEDLSISFDTLPREYPDFGRSDYDSPAYELRTEVSGHISAPLYKSHEVVEGKVSLEGLPFVGGRDDGEAQTLIITLWDEVIGAQIKLYYAVFEQSDAITRHAVITNQGHLPLILEKVLSANVDFYQNHDFELVHLYGAWARERQVSRIPIGHSSHVIDSKRGASSHEQNPFMALVRPDTTEFSGEVFAMNLVYSGSFIGEINVNAYGSTRMQMGIHPIDFEWLLEAGASFTTPEVVMVYSDEGFNGMSGIYHHLYRNNLNRGPWGNKPRPILINNWEATYFDFDEGKIKEIMQASAGLGIELFVLDDGWFGQRDSDTSSLGDWWVNKEKIPSGLKGLSDYAGALGMGFGLWFEPEMVSPDSDLYRQHPDWCLHVAGRRRSEARRQLILDMGREEVTQYLYDRIAEILSSADITYVKWDMNRNMTEVGTPSLAASRHKEVSHRYMLGLYALLERLTTDFPHVLFESCSGGGGRFDAGMHYYMPQAWTSDDTDGHERLKIQWGTSMVYPPVMMGAHVSAIPNHQVMRSTPLATRGHVAMAGNLGYELDVTTLSKEEKAAVAGQISLYKDIRNTVQFGRFYRLMSPYDGSRGASGGYGGPSGDSTAWMFVSQDGRQVVAFYYRHLARPNTMEARLKLRYLAKDALYETKDGQQFYGDTLRHFGIRMPMLTGDFDACMLVLTKVD